MQEAFDGNDRQDRSDYLGLSQMRSGGPDEDRRDQMGSKQPSGVDQAGSMTAGCQGVTSRDGKLPNTHRGRPGLRAGTHTRRRLRLEQVTELRA